MRNHDITEMTNGLIHMFEQFSSVDMLSTANAVMMDSIANKLMQLGYLPHHAYKTAFSMDIKLPFDMNITNPEDFEKLRISSLNLIESMFKQTYAKYGVHASEILDTMLPSFSISMDV